MNTVNVLYLACTIYVGHEIFYQLARIHLAFDSNQLIHTFINAHLVMYLIWRRDINR